MLAPMDDSQRVMKLYILFHFICSECNNFSSRRRTGIKFKKLEKSGEMKLGAWLRNRAEARGKPWGNLDGFNKMSSVPER